MDIRTFVESDRDEVIALWSACLLTRPWNDPVKDIARKLAVDDALFLVGVVDEHIVGSVMAGYDGHRGWINYLAVDPDSRHRGYATALLSEAERRLAALGCPKVNLQVRATNAEALSFYDRSGYVPDDVISLGKRLEHDR